MGYWVTTNCSRCGRIMEVCTGWPTIGTEFASPYCSECDKLFLNDTTPMSMLLNEKLFKMHERAKKESMVLKSEMVVVRRELAQVALGALVRNKREADNSKATAEYLNNLCSYIAELKDTLEKP